MRLSVNDFLSNFDVTFGDDPYDLTIVAGTMNQCHSIIIGINVMPSLPASAETNVAVSQQLFILFKCGTRDYRLITICTILMCDLCRRLT